MMRRAFAAALCVFTFVGVQAAAGVWDTKPFMEWTDKDIQTVLTDSPWAGKGNLTNVQSGGSFRPVPDWKVTVAWQSALPVKQAIMRQALGSGTPTPEQQKALDAAESAYIIRISGLPGMYANQAVAAQIGSTAELRRDGKPALQADQGGAQMIDKDGNVVEAPAPRGRASLQGGLAVVRVGIQRGGGGGGRGGGGGARGNVPDDGSTALLVFGFPKTDPITAADKEVEFSATVGTYFLKHKFKIKDMTVKGEPAL
jgi:hypothetical protein